MTKAGVMAVFCGILYTLLIGFVSYELGTMHPRNELLTGDSVAMAESFTSTPEPSPIATPEVTSYVIKEYNNRIGVYENDELVRIVNTPLSELRAEDAKKLKNGIELKTKEEVAETLEDFSS